MSTNNPFFDVLEPRYLLSLLGIKEMLGFPDVNYDSTGHLNYTPPSEQSPVGSFDSTAVPTSFVPTKGARPVTIKNPRLFELHFKTDSAGNLVGGIASADLEVDGWIDMNNNNVIDAGDYSGLLLTGEITQFGYYDSGSSNDNYDFRLVPTGGALMSFFAGKDIGLLMTSLSSTFIGDFSISFTGMSQGVLGPISPLRGSLSGQAFLDSNDNGTINDGESGINGVTVALDGTNVAGNAVHLTTTTATINGIDGSYTFVNLLPGTYSVTETQPDGYLTSAGSTNSYEGIVLGAGQNAVAYNFGEVLPASLSGAVYLDANDNGVMDGAEAGIAGVAITLSGTDDLGGAVSLATVTDGSGAYVLAGLRPGTYSIAETQPAGYLDDAAGINSYAGIVTASGTAAAGYDFGEIQPASLSGVVFLDANDNGVMDGAEAGIAGVAITLSGTDDLGGAVNIATVTDGSGAYALAGLRPGTYSIAETQPAGYLDDAAGINSYAGIAAASGTVATGYDFGEVLPASLAGIVFNDANVNGILNSGENGVGGATVTLSGTNDRGNAVNIVQTTNGSGAYAFSDLRPGTYTITSTLPAGYFEDPASMGGYSGIVADSGTAGVGYNFGVLAPASLSGSVYEDLNVNGQLNAGEPGINGVTVTLTGTEIGGVNVTRTQVTVNGGVYAFTNLKPGTYKITETQPTGYIDGADTAGSLGGTVANDVISAIAVAAGANGTGYNFAETMLGLISGTTLSDVTGNGLSADDETLGGVAIQLFRDRNGDGKYCSCIDGPAVAKVFSDDDGNYSFTNLTPGKYFVKEIVPFGYVRTGPALSDYYTVNVVAETKATNLNFDNYQKPDKTRVTKVSYLINGTKSVCNLRGNTNEGNLVQVVFTVTAGEPIQLTLVSYTAPDSTFICCNADDQVIYDVDTAVFEPGTYTLSVLNPNCDYQVDFVFGAAIDQLGPAGSNIFYSPQGRLISADNDGRHDLLDNSSSLSGVVYSDTNLNGEKDAGEVGLGNVQVTLTGIDERGREVRLVALTTLDGEYSFNNLRPGTYTVTEDQPDYWADAVTSVGSAYGEIDDNDCNVITDIQLANNIQATAYNFGETAIDQGNALTTGQTAAISFWKGASGQALIKSLNSGQNSKSLGNWLAANFSKLYGRDADGRNLAGKTNAQVASFFISLYNLNGLKLDAQVMATALASYVTDTDLAGTIAQKYGFVVNKEGTAAATFDVGNSGAAFNVATNTTMTIREILDQVNLEAVRGVLYANSTALRALAYITFADINATGGIV